MAKIAKATKPSFRFGAAVLAVMLAVGTGYIITASHASTLIGDINNSGKVDIYDLSALLAQWGKTGTNSADLNSSGSVDIFDVSALLAHWGETGTPNPSITPTPTAMVTDFAKSLAISGPGSPSGIQSVETQLGSTFKYFLLFPGDNAGDPAKGQDLGGAVAGSIRGAMLNRPGVPTDKNLGSLGNRMQFIYSLAPVFLNGTSPDSRTIAGNQQVVNLLTATANGTNDAAYKEVASALVNDVKQPNAIIRLGWEMTGNWFPWSIGSPTLYPQSPQDITNPGLHCQLWQQAWIRVHDDMMSVPGANFKFDFNSAGGNSYVTLADSCAYPGDKYVDVIGMDFYDRAYAPTFYTNPSNPDIPGWNNPAGMWKANFLPNLNTIEAMAKRHSKPTSFPEWGLEGTSSTGGIEGKNHPGGDDPCFIQYFHDWMGGLPATGGGSLQYQVYFWTNVPNEGPHVLTDPSLAKSWTKYQHLYGTTTKPDTTCPALP